MLKEGLGQWSQTRGPHVARLMCSQSFQIIVKIAFFVPLMHFLQSFAARGDIFRSCLRAPFGQNVALVLI